jgi:two-component system response regulator
MEKHRKEVRSTLRDEQDVPHLTMVQSDPDSYGHLPTEQDDLSEDKTLDRRTVVLVEDSDEDAMLFGRAIRKSGKNVVVRRASNARGARELLIGHRPALITLDCDLVGESGLDLLREIRSMESFSRVPVVMLSGSESDSDVLSAYTSGANSFLRKPVCCDEYVALVTLLVEYWLENNFVSVSPPRAQTAYGSADWNWRGSQPQGDVSSTLGALQ